MLLESVYLQYGGRMKIKEDHGNELPYAARQVLCNKMRPADQFLQGFIFISFLCYFPRGYATDNSLSARTLSTLYHWHSYSLHSLKLLFLFTIEATIAHTQQRPMSSIP